MERKDLGLRRRLAIEEFFGSMRVLPWPSLAAEIYANLRASIERSGTPIGDHDIMIAAHALALGAILVTNNTRHYSRFSPPLRLENWLNP
jgi:tRNA(fMet)-specific endonuclease VapC